MSGISGISSNILNSIFSQSMRSKHDPAEKFKELDTDSNGGLDKTELSSMAQDLSKMTGKTLNVDDMMTTYDANNDGLLNQDEMGTMMQQVLPPPNTGSGVSSQQAAQVYQANSGDDQMSLLLKMLGETANSSSTSTSSSDQITALLSVLEKSADSTSAANGKPSPEEMFNKLDSDGNSSLNTTELDAWAKDFSSMTGQTIDAASAISTYDANGDGELSKTEMNTMMQALQEKSGGPPPPPADMTTETGSNTTGETNAQQTVGPSQSGSNADQLSLLRQLLDQYAANLSGDSYKNFTSYM